MAGRRSSVALGYSIIGVRLVILYRREGGERFLGAARWCDRCQRLVCLACLSTISPQIQGPSTFHDHRYASCYRVVHSREPSRTDTAPVELSAEEVIVVVQVGKETYYGYRGGNRRRTMAGLEERISDWAELMALLYAALLVLSFQIGNPS